MWGPSQDKSETWDAAGSWEYIGVTLAESPAPGDEETELAISSSKAGFPVERVGHQTIHKISLFTRYAGINKEQRLMEPTKTGQT